MKALEEIEKLFKELLKDSYFQNRIFAVGGYCRDQYMGIESKDLDLVIEEFGGACLFALWLHSTFENQTSFPYEIGKGYPIWHIAFTKDVEYKDIVYHTSGAELDIAETQKEAFPEEGSRQRITSFGSIIDDIKRRDFTVNMLLKNMTTGKFEDICGQSIHDIEHGILRGHPEVDLNKTFSDDPLRMIRLLRFQAKYNWNIPMSVLRIARRNSHRISIVSIERIMSEIKKLGNIPQGLYRAVRLMKATNMLHRLLPDVYALIGCPNPELRKSDPRKIHLEGDSFKHTLLVLKNSQPNMVDQIAALFHDIGKAHTTAIEEDGRITCKKHDEVGGMLAEMAMCGLKFDSDNIEKIIKIIKNHMDFYNLLYSGIGGKRRFIRKYGDILEHSINLAIADSKSNLVEIDGKITHKEIPYELFDELRALQVELATEKTPIKPILNGHEIMELLEVKQGKIIGEVSEFLLEKQDEYGLELTKECARIMVIEKFYNSKQ